MEKFSDYSYVMMMLGKYLKGVHERCLERDWELAEREADEVVRLAIELKVEICRRQER